LIAKKIRRLEFDKYCWKNEWHMINSCLFQWCVRFVYALLRTADLNYTQNIYASTILHASSISHKKKNVEWSLSELKNIVDENDRQTKLIDIQPSCSIVNTNYFGPMKIYLACRQMSILLMYPLSTKTSVYSLLQARHIIVEHCSTYPLAPLYGAILITGQPVTTCIAGLSFLWTTKKTLDAFDS